MRLFIGLFFAGVLAAQSVSGTGTGAGQLATASASIVPTLQLALTISCAQAPPFSLNPANLWSGAVFNCTITTNQAAPAGGSIAIALTPTAPPIGSGVPAAGVTLTIVPTTVVIPSPGTTGMFIVKATSP